MKQYVLGFALYKNNILLMLKARPEFQKGFLNGDGGSIEYGETPEKAMSREFKEETNIFISPSSWNSLGLLQDPSIDPMPDVYCYYAFLRKYEYTQLCDSINRGIIYSEGEPLIFLDIYKNLEKFHKANKLMYNIFDIVIEMTERLYPRYQKIITDHKPIQRLKECNTF
jgi:8-oxo-dGTP pyrophosphatase MutT (NUDIX family)